MADENRLNSILCKFDADWMASDEARTEATNDLYFSRVSQWDDWLSNYTTLQYRNLMLFARWSGSWSQRCAGTLSTFYSDQKTELILMLPMC